MSATLDPEEIKDMPLPDLKFWIKSHKFSAKCIHQKKKWPRVKADLKILQAELERRKGEK